MTDQHHPVESPRTTPRRPDRASTNAGTTLAHPGAPSPFHPPEKDLSTDHGRPKGAAATPEQHPGDWPVPRSQPRHDQTWMRQQAEHARREIVAGSIRAELQEQPTPRAIRSAGRRWCRLITAMAEDIATQREAA